MFEEGDGLGEGDGLPLHSSCYVCCGGYNLITVQSKSRGKQEERRYISCKIEFT